MEYGRTSCPGIKYSVWLSCREDQPDGARSYADAPKAQPGNEGLLLAAPHLLKSDDWGISFTRNSWLNPAGMLPRPEVTVGRLSVATAKLERLSYFHVDHPSGVSPDVRVMLDGVHAFRLRFC
ncbi:type II secretion system protein GspJ [Escherichia coli]|nr:type II secretion system protein GspJ [Escherichia coli]